VQPDELLEGRARFILAAVQDCGRLLGHVHSPKSGVGESSATRYALKDLAYALELAAEADIDAPGARLARAGFLAAIAAGDGERYWPVIAEHIAREGAD
jgi:hypothetical protein